jgi:plastocyanin
MRAPAPTRLSLFFPFLVALCMFVVPLSRGTQEPPVVVQVNAVGSVPKSATVGRPPVPASQTAVWLVPLDRQNIKDTDASYDADSKPHPRITQHNKQFEPHLLVVQVGTVIDFPNRDPFFHNVFSLFEGKRFDLGLYEAGATNSARFDRQGISFLFCNIHPEMSAVVVTVDTPYFAVTNTSGRADVADVPDGSYELHIWSERALPSDQKKQVYPVTITATSRALAPVSISENPNFTTAHKNKYGQDYVPPASDGYTH